MSGQAIRVLHVIGSMNYGGAETWLMHVLRHIDRTKFQVDFCHTTPQPGAYALEIESLGGRMVLCPLQKTYPLDFVRRFRRILREGQYDAVHSHVYHFSGLIMLLARRESVPVRIAHSHTTSDGHGSGLSRVLYHALMKHWIRKHATHGLAASSAAAGALFESDWEADPRFRVLYCGIDLEPFRQEVSPKEVRRQLGIPSDAPVVGHVGSFRLPKNHSFLLEIVAEVIKRRKEVHLLLIGDGPLRPQMEAKARNLGIQKNVIFACARPDVPRLMLGAMDAFLFPSRWEGLPLAVVEAQAAGLRCLVSDAVPRDVAVISGAVKFLSLEVGPEQWSQRLLELLDQGRWPKEHALDEVERSKFNVVTSVEPIQSLYRSGAELGRAPAKNMFVPA